MADLNTESFRRENPALHLHSNDEVLVTASLVADGDFAGLPVASKKKALLAGGSQDINAVYCYDADHRLVLHIRKNLESHIKTARHILDSLHKTQRTFGSKSGQKTVYDIDAQEVDYFLRAIQGIPDVGMKIVRYQFEHGDRTIVYHDNRKKDIVAVFESEGSRVTSYINDIASVPLIVGFSTSLAIKLGMGYKRSPGDSYYITRDLSTFINHEPPISLNADVSPVTAQILAYLLTGDPIEPPLRNYSYGPFVDKDGVILANYSAWNEECSVYYNPDCKKYLQFAKELAAEIENLYNWTGRIGAHVKHNMLQLSDGAVKGIVDALIRCDRKKGAIKQVIYGTDQDTNRYVWYTEPNHEIIFSYDARQEEHSDSREEIPNYRIIGKSYVNRKLIKDYLPDGFDLEAAIATTKATSSHKAARHSGDDGRAA